VARASRRRRWDPRPTLVLGLLGLAGATGLGLLASSLGWLDAPPLQPRGAPPGTIAVPAAGVAIPAYTRVGLEHLVDPRTGDLRAVYLPEGSLLPETFVDAKGIVGRVLAVEKLPGQLFSETDFYPPGTREGIVAGIPTGKRALRIDAAKVSGIVGLGRGDRFDLIATLDLARGAGRGIEVEGTGMRSLGQLGSPVQAATIVAGGAVVQPLETRVIPGPSGQVVEEMVIAVDPEEVAALTEALHSGARIDCVPLSGRPEGVAAEPAASGARTKRTLSMVETIVGGERRVVAVRSGRRDADSLPSVSAAGSPSEPPQPVER